MVEIDRYTFTHREVVEALIKQQGLHEGIWMISMEFGIGAVNAGPTEDQIVPTAMVPIVKMGLAKADKESNISVDAARVNPAIAEAATKKE